ncbi:MAG: nitrous oxide reductase accessory protein NosL [Kiloniellaceae bacterium]
MKVKLQGILTVALLSLALAACDRPAEVAEAPPPADYGGDAIGYFCNMLLTEHGGPKGQVHLQSREQPLWFSSVRDTVAFTLLAGEPKDVTAIYVTDMGGAADWANPAPGTWVALQDAWLVIESRRLGGMGLPEVVPFATPEAARRYTAEQGGRVVRLAAVPPDYVLGMPQMPAEDGAADVTH